MYIKFNVKYKKNHILIISKKLKIKIKIKIINVKKLKEIYNLNF
jgi:hypothetical protein